MDFKIIILDFSFFKAVLGKDFWEKFFQFAFNMMGYSGCFRNLYFVLFWPPGVRMHGVFSSETFILNLDIIFLSKAVHDKLYYDNFIKA